MMTGFLSTDTFIVLACERQEERKSKSKEKEKKKK